MTGIQVIGMCESGNQQTDACYLPVNGRKSNEFGENVQHSVWRQSQNLVKNYSVRLLE